ncbi:MAG: filamentous hemagglutinin N-terminal domain-containing protein [Leptolyngbya sp. SIO3F4]|nr:filamentous hemagglutinin N-terminal domain-containing protein [Leptolyngbya sp. SIO3F4]
MGQVIPDGTTPTPDPGSCAITCTVTGGITDDLTGSNLFHSFREFSIPTNGMVIFDHSPTVNNIIARVTGENSISSIDGVIGTNATSSANVYLINPNGIIFGPNGGVEIGGSFLGTTADAIQFGDQGSFSALDTSNNPALLTINPSALIFNRDTPASITSQSIKPDLSLPPFLRPFFPPEGLKVQEGNSLLLVGGDIILEAPPNSFAPSILQAPGGRIDLGSLAGPGAIGLNVDGNNLSLSYEDGATFSDISLNNSEIEVSGENSDMPGQIVITANNLSLTDNSGISSTTRNQVNAGDITINTDNSIRIERSSITSETSGASGNGGSIEIVTGLLVLDADSSLRVNTDGGEGNAGNIFIDAETISLLARSNILSTAESLFSTPVGNAGNIQIQTNTLSLKDESEISVLITNSLNNNISGVLNIEAQDSIFVTDGSSITSATFQQGNANNINIITPALVIQDSSSISAATTGEGQAGNIVIQEANEVIVSDDSFISTSSLIATENNANFTGDSGEINIDTQLLTLSNGAQVTSSTDSDGNAGSIFIPNASLVYLSNGNIATETTAVGTGGNIILNTNQLTADSGARITATATATADATTQGGSVTLNTNQINLSGETTGILAETQGSAKAGLIILGPNANGDSLTVSFQENADISAATSSSGDGGQVFVIVPETFTLTGDGSLSTRSTGSGPAGDVSIQTDGLFRVQDGARVEVSGDSTGDSGTLEVISGVTVLNSGQLLASTQAGDDGNISLQIQDALVLRGDSLISAEAFNNANGGNVDISSPFIIALFPNGPNSNGNDIQASAVDGDGGRITISTNTLINIDENIAIDGNQSNDIDASSKTGIDGEVVIQNLEVDPTEGIEPLESDPANPEIAQGCGASSSGQFIASGQGGIRPNPYEPLSGDGIQEDIDPPGQAIAQQPNVTAGEPLVEAKGWNQNTQGEIVLLAESADYHSACQHTLTGAS